VPASQLTPRGQSRTAQSISNEVPEPLAKSLGEGMKRLTQNWESWETNSVAKWIVAAIVVMVALTTTAFWLPFAAMGIFLYCLYYPVWAWFIRPTMKPPEPVTPSSDRPTIAAQFVAAENGHQPTWHEQAAERKRRRYSWREQAMHEVAAKPLRVKASELLGSMLLAGVTCVVLSGIGTLTVFNDAVRYQGGSFPLFLWLSSVSTVGCWSILAINKAIEGRVEDQVPPRMLSLVAGLFVGLVAFGISSLLWIGLPTWTEIGPNPSDSLAGGLLSWHQTPMESQWRSGPVAPALAASVGYFALLFVLLRWWRMAEYTRRVRVSVWTIAWIPCAAWLLHLGWWFPQPTGMAVAAIIATSVQLASPWMPPSRRRELAARAVA
jgi:hypothetical protein